MLAAIFGAIILYTIIGFIPGTDETAVLLPITLAVVLAGTPPIVVLAFFISAIVTLNLMNAIPTALVGLPGGVMSTPMIEHALYLKNKGMSAISIKKMAMGTVIGVLISVPTSLLLAHLLAPFAENVKQHAALLFVFGAIFLALIGKNKILSLISIIPMALLFQGLRFLYWGVGAVPEGKAITTSFFLGITVGPLIVSLLTLLNKEKREQMPNVSIKEIEIKDSESTSEIINKKSLILSATTSFISNFTFFLSPVGMTLLLGNSAVKKEKNADEQAKTAMMVMSCIAISSYIAGVIIPLLALGIPLSPVALGPANALFNAQPIFSVENNIHHILSKGEFIFAVVLAAGIAAIVTYWIAVKYAKPITLFVLKKIPHEAVLGLFISFILLLTYMDAGLINIFGVLLVSIAAGTLNRLGVSYGVLFMTLYAAPFIASHL